ncbi:MAG: S8 family serine peptidase, partial [Phycisphaerales bacterium]|nr:S8 family serine peptidase [Phycisphaerales bacterium]
LQTDGTGIFLYTNPGDIESDYAEAIHLHGADIANNSIGTNVCRNFLNCDLTGDYGVTSAVIDAIAAGALGQPFRIIWANGNERACAFCCAVSPNQYHSTAPPACAKNSISVGALNSNDDSVAFFTSWGPTDDGRLKPDISAPGCQSDGDDGVTSCSASSGYVTFCGTSMATPTVTGLSALLLQAYRRRFPDRADFTNATLKALLAHNAADVAAPGPDYQSGYGSVRIVRTIDSVNTDSVVEANVSGGGVFTMPLLVLPGDTEIKVTIAWDDPPGTPNVSPALVNDLDLRILDPQLATHHPWTLDPIEPDQPATSERADHLNNMEQVYVSDPRPGKWTIQVAGFNVPQGPQSFSVCVSPPRERDCDGDGRPDSEQITEQPQLDCTSNGILDSCEADCNGNSAADSCDILNGLSNDCNGTATPDECEPFLDCNHNYVFDACEARDGLVEDCNGDFIPDSCLESELDCDSNGLPDECDLASGGAFDCNANGRLDSCDIASGEAVDCQPDGMPDECQLSAQDCNGNLVPDICDIRSDFSADQDSDGAPDECTVAVLFVDADAAGRSHGTTWTDAYRDMQTAIDTARVRGGVAEVWIAKGTYRPTELSIPGDPRSATFLLPSGLALYGGFVGHETARAQRDFTHNVTTLSGDLMANDGTGSDATADNAYRVVTSIGADASAVMDGFVVTAGRTSTLGLTCEHFTGGGMYIEDGTPTVSHCVFRENVGAIGGGMYIEVGSPVVSRCEFIHNVADRGSAVGSGNLRSLSVLGDNLEMSESGFYAGGGPLFDDGGDPTFVDCLFHDNESRFLGGAMWMQGGKPTLIRSQFIGNVAKDGGAVAGQGADLALINCAFLGNGVSGFGGAVFSVFDSSLHAVNTIFSGNTAGEGGGIHHRSGSVNMSLSHCTLHDNVAAISGGGVWLESAVGLDISNSILWNNRDATGTSQSAQLLYAAGTPFVASSCVQSYSGGFDGDSIRTDDPRFVNALGPDGIVGTHDDDLRLSPNSPYIDAAANALIPLDVYDIDGNGETAEATPVDLAGVPRRFDAPDVGDTGSGTAPIVDLGAYEYGDCNGNGTFDPIDVSTGESPDCNTNAIPDECDVSAHASRDCNGNNVPDGCEPDCDADGVADDCEINDLGAPDRNRNGVPDYCESTIVFVRSSADGLGSGLNWHDAFVDLQAAVAYASAAEGLVTGLWVAEGVYRPAGIGGDRNASFRLMDGVTIYGGFAGGETALGERDWRTHFTELSGDLNGDDTPDFGQADDNAYHVLVSDDAGPGAVIDGMIITGGRAIDGGGGVRVVGGAPVLRHCRITGNTAATAGGGLHSLDAAPELIDCSIESNLTGADGGGVFVTNGVLSMHGGALIGNQAGSRGGGLFALAGGDAQLQGVRIAGNLAAVGGGIYAISSDLELYNARLHANSSSAVHVASGSAAMFQCIFSGNTGADAGGAVRTSGGSISLQSCTVSGNFAPLGGGLFADSGSTTGIVNSILWNNRDAVGTRLSGQVAFSGPAPTIAHSCVQGWTDDFGGIGNTAGDPKFIDGDGLDGDSATDDDDFRIAAGSSCIDAGDATRLPPGELTDVSGQPRLVDDPTVSDSGVGGPPAMDMGAYEYQEDCDENNVLDSVDIVELEISDCNRNGVPDLCDIGDGRLDDADQDGIPDICEYSVLLVDGRATGAGNGSSWADAYESLQDALLHAAGSGGNVTEIWIAADVYRPADAGADRRAAFRLVDGVAVYGGFAGGESAREHRDPMRNRVVLSGDLNGDDDSSEGTRLDNAHHVVTAEDVDAGAVLDGVTIAAGVADGDFPDDHGGGIWVFHAAPTIGNARVIGNTARWGGGVSVENGAPRFVETTIIANQAEIDGGGIHNAGESLLILEQCMVEHNTAGGRGGAMANTGAELLLFDSVVEGNGAGTDGGGIANFDNGKVMADDSRLTRNVAERHGGAWFNASHRPGSGFAGCTFRANVAGDGGAVYDRGNGSPRLHRCRLDGNLAFDDGGGVYADDSSVVLRHCLLADNTAIDDGGGMYVAGGTPRVEYSTVVNNSAVDRGAGLFAAALAAPTLVGCIVQDNGVTNVDGDSERIIVSYSTIEGDWPGTGNRGADARFVNPELGDVRLLPDSPAINAGPPDAGFDEAEADLSGEPRVQFCRVDQGAFESDYFDDCNGDGLSDACQTASSATVDCNADAVPDSCQTDCNANGRPDDCDIAAGASHDCDADGVPDDCQSDCNANGVFDGCEVADGSAPDCDRNCLPDECAIAEDAALDCNHNAVPDVCDVGRFEVESGPTGPIDFARPRTHVFVAPPVAVGDVEIQLSARTDLASADEWIDVRLNGIVAGRLFANGGRDCPEQPDAATMVLAAGQFNQLVNGGDAAVLLLPSPAVDAAVCSGLTFVDVGLHYRTAASSADCDSNDVPDECEINDGVATDVNVNGVPDSCERLGDFDGDGQTTLSDFASWNPCRTSIVGGTAGDCARLDMDGDGDIDLVDFGLFQRLVGHPHL